MTRPTAPTMKHFVYLSRTPSGFVKLIPTCTSNILFLSTKAHSLSLQRLRRYFRHSRMTPISPSSLAGSVNIGRLSSLSLVSEERTLLRSHVHSMADTLLPQTHGISPFGIRRQVNLSPSPCKPAKPTSPPLRSLRTISISLQDQRKAW